MRALGSEIARRILTRVCADLVTRPEIAWAGICEPEPDMRWVAFAGETARWPADPELNQRFHQEKNVDLPSQTALLTLELRIPDRDIVCGLVLPPSLLVVVVPASNDFRGTQAVHAPLVVALRSLRESFPLADRAPPLPEGGGSSTPPTPLHAWAWLPVRLPRRPK